VYNFAKNLCTQQADSLHSHENEMFATLYKAKPNTEIVRGLKLVVLSLITIEVHYISFNLLYIHIITYVILTWATLILQYITRYKQSLKL